MGKGMRSEHTPKFGNALTHRCYAAQKSMEKSEGRGFTFFQNACFWGVKKLHVMMCPLHTLQNFKEDFRSTYSTKHVFHSKNMCAELKDFRSTYSTKHVFHSKNMVLN